MQADKQTRRYVKRLVALSLENDQVSEERVQAVLEAIRNKPPRRLKMILKLYLNYIKKEYQRTHAVLETAGALSEDTQKQLAEMLSKAYGRNIDIQTEDHPELLAGFRILIADDIWDASASGHLTDLHI